MPIRERTIDPATTPRAPLSSASIQYEIDEAKRAIAELHSSAPELAAEKRFPELDDNTGKAASLIARINALAEARRIAALREADEARAERTQTIEHVATVVLPAALAELSALITKATHSRSSDDLGLCDVKARQVSTLRSRLLDLTGDMQRFHPSQAPDLRRLFGKDAELIERWKRMRNPYSPKPPVTPLAGAEVLDGLAPLAEN